MPEPYTIEQQRAFFDEVWRNQNPYTGDSYAVCPNDGYRMTAKIHPFANKRASIFVFCPRCGRTLIEPELDPRAISFRDWTDDEKQSLVDSQFQGRPVVCPVDGTRIRTATHGDNVYIHCRRCGQIHNGSLHERIGTLPPQIEASKPIETFGQTYLELLNRLNVAKVETGSEAVMEWDLFISHAHEDKKEVADPLAKAFRELGLKVWYDSFVITLGDSIRRKVDEGLSKSRFGLVILSHHFFKKKWPQKELDALASLEYANSKKILPVWHNLTHEDVAHYSPTLAGVLGVPTSEGLDSIIEQVMAVVRPDGAGSPTPTDSSRGLPQEALAILKGAASSRVPSFFAASSLEGYRVHAGDYEFREEGNPRAAARVKGAVRKLMEAGYITQVSETRFELTEAGFEFVDRLGTPPS